MTGRNVHDTLTAKKLPRPFVQDEDVIGGKRLRMIRLNTYF